MTELLHSQLADYLKKAGRQKQPSAYLIHGQEMLVAQSSETLTAHLLAGESEDLCCEKVDGADQSLSDVLERLNTFALLGGPKIVLFKDAKLFEGRFNQRRLTDQIAEAWHNNDVPQAAKHFLHLCGRMEIDLEDVLRISRDHEALKIVYGQLGSNGVAKLAKLCLDQGWQPQHAADDAGTLQRAVEKGFPDNHYLIVAVHSKVPKNLKLYKAFREKGEVIDCNIPLGDRKADKTAQEAVLRKTLDAMLAKSEKRLSPTSFQTLWQLTGFDPRTFVQNIDKLIDYSGKRHEITEEDIHVVLRRTKSDPVFELTNAVADRNIVQALFYLRTLLDAKWHPLQILSALANQLRKLLLAKSFVTSAFGNCWTGGMGYPQFQKSVMPAIEAFDNHTREQTGLWEMPATEPAGKGRGSKKKTAEIVLAANPSSSYPVYQTLLKSEKYSLQELVAALAHLNRDDLRLKSTGQDAALTLKKTILDICGFKRG